MKDKKLSTLSKSALVVGLLLSGISFTAQAQSGPSGIGACAETLDPMTGATGWMGHPCTQPRPGPSAQSHPVVGGVEDTSITQVVTPEGHFPSVDPFANPPGSNFLNTIFSNMYDFNGDEMPNTLPSTPSNPYNLHEGPVLTQAINPASPEDDLDFLIDRVEQAAVNGTGVDAHLIELGIAILEGDREIAAEYGRAYAGFPMLHFNGPNKAKKVEVICEQPGGELRDNGTPRASCEPFDKVVGGNVNVNMIYFNQHIKSDTAFVDPSLVQEVPWTITYNINILNRGMEDFSPMAVNFDRIGDNRGPFHVAMDQTYFPMLAEGTKYTIKIKQNKGKYYNIIYTWGWRLHPPRVQVLENALKTAGPDGDTLPEWEKKAFCEGGKADTNCDPVNNAGDRAFAISQIGDLSPAKRMWSTFSAMSAGSISSEDAAVALRAAFLDWTDRTQLPSGVEADLDSNLTLFYVNNTIYGSRQGLQGAGSKLGPASYKGTLNSGANDWNIRPFNYRVTLLNGDHFPHGYMNVDFGGSRGWENQFQLTDPTTMIDPNGPHTGPTEIQGRQFSISDDQIVLTGEENIFPINRGGTEEFLKPDPRNQEDPDNGAPQLGSGCFFTFGRNHLWPNAGGPWGAIVVPPVSADGIPSQHVVEIEYNYEPSTRLRMYQFDPFHHDQAIYSLH